MLISNDAQGESTSSIQGTDRPVSVQQRTSALFLLISILLILAGGIIANITQTAGGQIAVHTVNFAGTDGVIMSGLLYVPNTATTKTPACGVVAIHGYINSHDTMDGVAIEMARRGCVVLASDQTGQGASGGAAFVNGYGGPDALAYLNSLSIVQKGDVGLIGHSMGGWASVIAAATYPGDYRSLVLMSSSTSTPQLEPIPGTAQFPKNTAVVEAQYSEFSALMWAEPTGTQFPQSARMQALFGLSGPIQTNHVYGSIANGTARQLNLVPTTHPGLTFSNEGIGDSVAWMQQTLSGVSTLPSSDQIWIWDEIGTLLALIGIILLIFPVGALLLRTRFFSELVSEVPASKAAQGIGWWIGVVVLVLLGVLTFFSFQTLGNLWLPASALFPQTITTGIMVWAFGGAVIGLVLFLLWHLGINRRHGAGLHNYGITGEKNDLEWKRIGKALLLALVVLFAVYTALEFLNWAFNTDVRIWVFNIKVITPSRLLIILAYVIPFTCYFLMLGVILHGQLGTTRLSTSLEITRNIGIMAGGFVLFLLYEYIPLLAGGTLSTADQPLLSIVAFQFVPVYIIVAAVSTYFYRKTGRIYAGAFINGILITAIIVASTATQYVVAR
jgi:pimeloyl-ACP methyl ester carboxylesterase